MKKNMKKYLMVLLAFLLVCTGIPGSSLQVQAASVSLSQRKLTLAPKQKRTLRLIGTSKKAKWSSSNTKVVSVSKSSGRITAHKTGKATITAKLGKKKYKCAVTVKAGTSYKTLYKKFLAENEEIKYFTLLNINKKGVPELITTCDDGSSRHFQYDVYTVSGSKAVYSGGYITGYQSKPIAWYDSSRKAMYTVCNFGTGDIYEALFCMSGTKLKPKYCTRQVSGTGYYLGASCLQKTGKGCYIDNSISACTKVSYAEYSEYKTNNFSVDNTMCALKSNSAANRKAYIH